MSGGVYGGDEVGAIVIDIGSRTTRAGFAGEDCPKVDIPTLAGVIADVPQEGDGDFDSTRPTPAATTSDPSSSTSAPTKKYIFGQGPVKVARKGMELTPFVRQGLVEDSEMLDRLLKHVFANELRVESSQGPILFSEPAWNTRNRREQLCELAFESLNAPAFFVCKSPVLSTFANGRSSALVVDMGATCTSVVPVYDGFALSQGIVRFPIGGEFLVGEARRYLESLGIDLTPAYEIAEKQTVRERESPQFKRKTNLPPVTKSFHEAQVNALVEDFVSSVLQVSDDAFNAEVAETMPTVHYELPTGYHQDFAAERQRLPELFFDPQTSGELRRLAAESASASGGGGSAGPAGAGGPPGVSGAQASMLSLPAMLQTAATLCDVDVRGALYGGIVLVGGNSLVTGLSERLQHEVLARLQTGGGASLRMKLIASSNSVERRFAPWLGGSILASLGTFHQMWISKLEYEENGRAIVGTKCP